VGCHGHALSQEHQAGRGVRFNISKTGAGVSAGVTGARYSVHPSGSQTTTARLPGTDVYYMKWTGGHGGKATRATKAAPVRPLRTSPGLGSGHVTAPGLTRMASA
jgi:Protein of unknown function (DUF4236)